MMPTITAYDERLTAIAGTEFGELSDDQILQLLAERKQLSELKLKYDVAQEERALMLAAETQKSNIEQELARLNTLISPDRPDDELIRLVEERRGLEMKLAEAQSTLAQLQGGSTVGAPAAPSPKTAPTTKGRAVKKKSEAMEPVALEEAVVPEILDEPVLPAEVTVTESTIQDAVDEEYGALKIQGDIRLEPGSELGQSLDRIMSDPDAIGTILDSLPPTAKSDKAFMLGVAAVDPAYAMHYADKETLKKDEDFNLRVLSAKGQRVSGQRPIRNVAGGEDGCGRSSRY